MGPGRRERGENVGRKIKKNKLHQTKITHKHEKVRETKRADE